MSDYEIFPEDIFLQNKFFLTKIPRTIFASSKLPLTIRYIL